jgi:hypothetical protein
MKGQRRLYSCKSKPWYHGTLRVRYQVMAEHPQGHYMTPDQPSLLPRDYTVYIILHYSRLPRLQKDDETPIYDLGLTQTLRLLRF